jgi:hypothetical protein
MRSSSWSAGAAVVAFGFLFLLFYNGRLLSCDGLLRLPGWVRDEASCAGRSADTFHPAGINVEEHAEQSYFSAMDSGIQLTPEENAGRNMWMVWTGGNDRFWDELIKYAFGAFDLLKIASSNPRGGFCTDVKALSYSYDDKYDDAYWKTDEAYWAMSEKECKDADGRWISINRDNRWRYYGLVNEPCFEKATKPDEYGLWIDEPAKSKDCPLDDPFKEEGKYPGVKIGARGKTVRVGSYYGRPTGIVGLRLFPNPAFDEKAKVYWKKNVGDSGSADKYYNDPAFYTDKNLVRPYRVGMACAFCHVGPSPTRPPDDSENPKWENLSSTVGAQYLWFDRVFTWNPQDHKNFIYQLLHTARPGTFDTSLVSSDNINNPRTMNAIYSLGSRLEAAKRRGKERLAGGSLNNRQFNDYPQQFVDGISTHAFFQPPDTVWTPHVLKDGSDSAGVLGSLNRVYLNIGLFSEEWLLHFYPFVGATPLKAITPIKIADAERNSEYWKATEAQTPYMAQFLLKAGQPDHLKDAPKGNELPEKYLSDKQVRLDDGKKVFAERCARCHSSKIPTPAVGLDDGTCDPGKDYLLCWNKYWAWTKTDAFKKAMLDKVIDKDFLKDNYLSTDLRVPVTLLQTNVCSPLATNAIAHDIWDNFSSQTYKDLPSVGSIEVFPRWEGEKEDFDPFTAHDPLAVQTHWYPMPAGGRGYTRVPSLISLWSTAPFLLNNTLGKFDPNPSVETRLRSFDSSIRQLLWPETREKDATVFPSRDAQAGAGTIDRTTTQSYLTIPAGYLPGKLTPSWRTWLNRLLPRVFDADGIKIGPIPAGTPVNLLASLNLSGGNKKQVADLLLRTWDALKGLPSVASDEQARRVFAPLVPDLLSLSKCPDLIVNKGHYFGTEFFAEEQPGLSNSEKEALIAFLMTF